MTERRPVDGVLLLYHHFPAANAPTIMEHVRSFERFSRYPVIAVNTDDGYPPGLDDTRFKVVVLHYSLFAGPKLFLGAPFLRYLEPARDVTTIAFFQDEHRFCRERFAFIDRYGVDIVFTLLEPPYGEEVYRGNSSASRVVTTLTGYVDDELVARAAELARPLDERPIDVGYRARQLPFWMGRGGQEKHEIGERFLERAADLPLRTDVAVGEASRIYGDRWYEFVASCRGMLGVEAGVSVFDLDGTARERTEALLERSPALSFAEVERAVLHEYEDRIPYRTVSPRHLEAAAFRVVQILYDGHYSGVLEPDVHYLALAKDFSNFDDVMARFDDAELCAAMTERAYQDVIGSGAYSYRVFIERFDEVLAGSGLREPGLDGVTRADIERRLGRAGPLQRVLARSRHLRTRPFKGRSWVTAAYRKLQSVRARRR